MPFLARHINKQTKVIKNNHKFIEVYHHHHYCNKTNLHTSFGEQLYTHNSLIMPLSESSSLNKSTFLGNRSKLMNASMYALPGGGKKPGNQTLSKTSILSSSGKKTTSSFPSILKR